MADPTPAQVRDYIAAGLPCEHLDVEGDGRHFFATIVSASFEGKLRVARHQLVYKALGERMRLQGELDDSALHAAYANADLFVLPSHYEGYGMVVTEAVAAGLPVLCTTGGALRDTLPPEAGIAVPAGDVAALAAALRNLLSHPEARLALRDGARRARTQLTDWKQAGSGFAAALERLSKY